MLSATKSLQIGITSLFKRRFLSTSVYDIQERTIQEPSPYTKTPSNIFIIPENLERKQLNDMLQYNKLTKDIHNKKLFNDNINGLNNLN